MFQALERSYSIFQQPVTFQQIQAMCEAAFGRGARVASAVELGLGSYNSIYRVDTGGERLVVLRVAPAPARQSRTEHQLMRNEHATVPYLAPVMAMIPRTLAIDFTSQ